jgi:hypothetical protein
MANSVRVARTRQDSAHSNFLAARIILANTSRYGGPESLMVRWARLSLVNSQPEKQAITGEEAA